MRCQSRFFKSADSRCGGGRRLRAGVRPWLLASSSALAILLADRAHAANVNWTGATSSDWTASSNWSTGATPTSADSVTIDTTSPNTTTIDGTTTPASGSLAVGQSGTGFLLIQNAGHLTGGGDAMLGVNPGANGSVAVTGISSWDLGSAHDLYAAYAGHGGLTINGSGVVVSDRNGFIGELGSGVGQVTVNAGRWNNSGSLVVGNNGTGALLIAGGGEVLSNAASVVGGSAGSMGTVTIDGTSSTLNVVAALSVGVDGNGAVSVKNGGVLLSDGADIAANAHSNGAVVVDGSSSKWQLTTGTLNVGSGGTGSLLVTNGGSVSNPGGAIGYFAGSSGTVTVDGQHSTWNAGGITDALVIGYDGQAAVTVRNGALMSSGATLIGGGAGSAVLSVDGQGTEAHIGFLVVAVKGSGTLNLTGGARLQSQGDAGIAVVTGSVGTVLASGASTAWDLQGGRLYIGQFGGSGTLTVSDGASVSSTGARLYLALGAGSIGVVNIGSGPSNAAAAPGTLDLATIQFGAGAGTFNFNHTGVGYVFAPSFEGSGTINQIAGDTTLSADSSAFKGATNVTGGRLAVNGSLSNSTITVSGSGTLAGTGVVGSTQVNSGGTFAPGSGVPGTSMVVAGNLAFQSGAFYLVQVSPSAASFANVTGSASLAGSVQAVFANGSYINKTYTILSASGGISGSFAPTTVNTNLPANFSTSLSYDANDAYLNLVLNFAIPGGLNRNQQAVGNALTNFFNTNGSIPVGYAALAPAGLTQASGELGTASQQTTFDAMSQFMGLLTDPFMQRSGGAGLAPGATGFAEEDEAGARAARKRTDAFAMFTKAPPVASFAQRWSVWAAGFGGSQSTDGNAVTGSNDTTSRLFGSAVGADYLFSPNTLAGFALAGGGTNFSVNGLGSGRSDLFQAGAYVRHTEGPAYISAALAYGWQDVTTDRTVTIAGLDHLRAEFNAQAYSGRAEGGYRFVAPVGGGVGLTPYSAAQFTTFDLPAYAEQVISGSSAFALNYASKSVTDTRSELGLRTDKSYAFDHGVLTLRSRFAWAHDFNPDRSIVATFQALPGASFVVNGAAQAPDSALTTASVEMKWLNGWSAAATFEGEFSNVTRSYAAKGLLRYAW